MRLRTPSLRRRVTVAVLAMLSLMLVTVGVVTDLVLANRLDSQLRERLVDRGSIAEALSDKVDARDLARRLEGDGVSVVLTTADGKVYAEGPLGGAGSRGAGQPAGESAQTPAPGDPGGPGPKASAPAPKPAVVQSGDRLSVTQTLGDGSTVRLLADAGDISRTLSQVRVALVLAGLAVLLAAAFVVPPVVSRTLRPLSSITEVARSITRGDRDRRLRPLQPHTELGRTAVAFDDMLDAVVGAETRSRLAEERMRDFLSDAAHELRTPVAGVQAAAEHLLRDDPPRDQRESALLGLVRESQRTGRLVEDLLVMARIDQGLTLRREPVELREIAQLVSGGHRLRRPDLDLVVEGGPVSIDGDPDRLTQVLANLVDNALRHAVTTVTVSVWRTPGLAGLTVCDDGAGVPADQRERVFERLVRLDASRSADRGGAGLGLTIARGIARAHGGELRAEARADGRAGACFVLRLPASSGPAPDPASAAAASPVSG